MSWPSNQLVPGAEHADASFPVVGGDFTGRYLKALYKYFRVGRKDAAIAKHGERCFYPTM